MFDRWFLNRKKRKMHKKISHAKKLIKENNLKSAENLYINLLSEYKRFCIKATYFEKISMYHDLSSLYQALSENKLKESRPPEVITQSNPKKSRLSAGKSSGVSSAGRKVKPLKAQSKSKSSKKIKKVLMNKNLNKKRSRISASSKKRTTLKKVRSHGKRYNKKPEPAHKTEKILPAPSISDNSPIISPVTLSDRPESKPLYSLKDVQNGTVVQKGLVDNPQTAKNNQDVPLGSGSDPESIDKEDSAAKEDSVAKEDSAAEDKPTAEDKLSGSIKPIAMPKTNRFRTAIDDLYQIIEDNGMISLNKAASMMKLSSDIVEAWAKILDERGLIKINYPAFSGTQLISISWERKESEDKARKSGPKGSGIKKGVK